jgi:serine/threonine protein kinase/formylglycine-generating enzyme required for sulfatase activity
MDGLRICPNGHPLDASFAGNEAGGDVACPVCGAVLRSESADMDVSAGDGRMSMSAEELPPGPSPPPPRVAEIAAQLRPPAAATVQEARPALANDVSQPEQIGRYRVASILGEGRFGRVYLAHDGDLHRDVAIKVPLFKHVSRPDDVEGYLAEARTLAALNHPHIVPVFDVGRTENGSCFVVSKFIEGTDLARLLKETWPTCAEAARLVATVAEALHYAHSRGIVHRDIKPANILIDAAGTPIVADFGLALKDADFGKERGLAGTPVYMSPEQANGEGHRVDGRSDIFSLGVVFYELLAKRRPFKADTQDELLEQIANVEAKPPRQIDHAIPKELERICLKALSKRASDRYTAAIDMADDLRHFLDEQAFKQPAVVSEKPTLPLPATPASPSVSAPGSGSKPIKIVPKGLRSFDAHDASFFLELLPGPRDRDDLPDSIRFWKTRIEDKDAEKAFNVGLICGPSGCGKSSLVKAGLLPCLSNAIIAVYVETTAKETEARLLNGLRNHCPSLAPNLPLQGTLAALRRGQGIPAGKKVLIVLDQFEQWLHAKKDEENTELVQALRQCDGVRLQTIVMVRDDFWMAVIRFMRELEIRFVDGQNSAAVDLFPMRHAEKVLAAFGRAFGCLPEKIADTTNEQKQFLEKAVAGLAREGKIICIRLSLFAEMMKGKSWTLASLKAVGGTEGVGVTFLEETFSATTAPPEHRYHQKAARAVLKALLPESGTEIKGTMRSRAELLEASGYKSRPKDFDDLIRILDGEIRLLTPTDPEGVESGESRVEGGHTLGSNSSAPTPTTLHSQLSTRFYQLTHDYLVPALRDWLTGKQKETRRGRAELLLADRSAVWNSRSENRQLPSLLQWFQIHSLTAKKNWTPPQRKMMRKATRYHVFRTAVAALVVTLIGFGSWEGFGRLEGRRLRDNLLASPTADVPGIIKDMASYRRWVDPLLQDAYARAEKENESRKQLHASLALLPVDSEQVEYLYGRLLKGDPHEVMVIREGLLAYKADLTERLWTLLEDPKNDQDQRFRASCALSVFSPDDARWAKASGGVAETLVNQEPLVIAQWTAALKGAGRWLIPPFADFLVDENRSVSAKGLIAKVYGTYATDTPDAYARLKKRLVEASEPNASMEAKIALAKKRASIGIALFLMGKGEEFWPLMKHSSDPTSRSYLMEWLGASGVDPKFLIARLKEEKEVSVKRAILLSLGEFGLDRLSLAERRNHLPWLLQLYRDDPDPGIHGAAEWLLRQWGEAKMLRATDGKLAIDEQFTAEQKERIAKSSKNIEEIEKRLAATEKAFPVRQAEWEQKLREKSASIPASLVEGLIAHFALDETKGNETANAVAGQPAALYQGTGNPVWTRGVVGGAWRLNGDGTVTGGKPLNLIADQAFSYGCWFQYSDKDRMVLISTRDRWFRGFDLCLDETHRLRLQIAGADPKFPNSKSVPPFCITVITITRVDPALRPGWHHALVTYDGTKKAKGVRVFVDGEAQPTRIVDDRLVGTILGDGPVFLGSERGGYRFRGVLDDVRIYDRPLSETEARQLYESGVQVLARFPAEDRDPQQRQLVADYYHKSLQRLKEWLAAERLSAHELSRMVGIARGRQWYVNSEGQTMAVVMKPGEFWMGEGPERHRRTIARSFAIATKEVTVDEFLRFRKEHNALKEYAATGNCPVISVTWFEAAAYCNWLSEKEGIPKEQWCYEQSVTSKDDEGMKMADNYLRRTGYRLPMEEEWEYVCRAGGDTGFSFGESADLIGKYAWIYANSLSKSNPVGLLKPNDLGVFDMHGNAWEWCQDSYVEYRKGGDGEVAINEDIREIFRGKSRVMRGGSSLGQASVVRSAYRLEVVPMTHFNLNGFRLARTFIPEFFAP